MTVSWSQLTPSSAIHIVLFTILYPPIILTSMTIISQLPIPSKQENHRYDILPRLSLSVWKAARLLWVGGQLLLLMCCWVVKPCERYCRSAGAKGIGVRGHAGNTMAKVFIERLFLSMTRNDMKVFREILCVSLPCACQWVEINTNIPYFYLTVRLL